MQKLEVKGKRMVQIPERDYKELMRRAKLAMPDGDMPRLPALGADGNYPALEYARASLAREIIRTRRRLGLSQVELARRAGIPPERLNRLDPKLTFAVYSHVGMADTSRALDNLPGLDNPQAEKQTAMALKTGTDNLPVSTVAEPADTTHGTNNIKENSLAFCLALSDGKRRTLANAGGLKAAQRNIEQTRMDGGDSRVSQGVLSMRPAGIEPTTVRLEGGCSIQLSYGRAQALSYRTGAEFGK